MPGQRGEITPCQDLSIGLYRQARDTGIGPRVERAVQTPIGVEPANVISRLSAQRDEIPTYENLPVTLDRQGIDGSIDSRVEGDVQTLVGVEPSEEVSWLAAQCAEPSSHQYFPIRLHCQGIDVIVGPWVEGRIGCDLVDRQHCYRTGDTAILIAHHHRVAAQIASLHVRE